jgi:hypothetical protein
LEARETLNKEIVGLPGDFSAEVKRIVMINSIQVLLYLIAGRNCYLGGRGNCKSRNSWPAR